MNKARKRNPNGAAASLNGASYELALAKSIASSLAEDLGNESESADRANMLWSVVDHMTRAKAIIDGESGVSHG